VGFDLLSEELWMQVLFELDGRSLSAAACACSGLAAVAGAESLWSQLHADLFFERGDAAGAFAPPGARLLAGSGLSQRERVCLSEARLDSWRCLGRRAPAAYPLPAMTSVALLGNVGVSTHAGRLVRLWEAGTGRRLAAYHHRHDLSAVAGLDGPAGCLLALGDVAGGVSVFAADSADFAPLALPRAAGAVRSLALVGLGAGADRRVAVLTASAGELTASVVRCAADSSAWPPADAAQQAHASLRALEVTAGADELVSVAAGPANCACVATPTELCVYDLPRALLGGADGGADGSAAVWRASWTPPQQQQPQRAAAGGRRGWGDAGSDGGAVAEDDAALLPGVLRTRLSLSDAAEAEAAAAAETAVAAAAAHSPPAGARARSDEQGRGAWSAGAGRDVGGTAGVAPSRLLSYSPAWGLLCAGMAGGVVALWDARLPPAHGCAAALQLAAGEAGWLHLDEGCALSGHLLVAPASGEGLFVYDVRRVASAREPAAARAVASVPAAAPGASVACFAAQGALLVVGGGARSTEAWRYRIGADADDADDDEARQSASKPARAKPPRTRHVPAYTHKRTSRPQ
jgi:hypothetical protein